MKIKQEVLNELIEEAQNLYSFHLHEMTKFEQRMNVLKSFRIQKISKASLN